MGYLSLPGEVRGIFSVIFLCKYKKFEFSGEGGGADPLPPRKIQMSPPFLDPRMHCYLVRSTLVQFVYYLVCDVSGITLAWGL